MTPSRRAFKEEETNPGSFRKCKAQLKNIIYLQAAVHFEAETEDRPTFLTRHNYVRTYVGSTHQEFILCFGGDDGFIENAENVVNSVRKNASSIFKTENQLIRGRQLLLRTQKYSLLQIKKSEFFILSLAAERRNSIITVRPEPGCCC